MAVYEANGDTITDRGGIASVLGLSTQRVSELTKVGHLQADKRKSFALRGRAQPKLLRELLLGGESRKQSGEADALLDKLTNRWWSCTSTAPRAWLAHFSWFLVRFTLLRQSTAMSQAPFVFPRKSLASKKPQPPSVTRMAW
jgi:hypothetical protein